jgi:hypothetical protein
MLLPLQPDSFSDMQSRLAMVAVFSMSGSARNASITVVPGVRAAANLTIMSVFKGFGCKIPSGFLCSG